MKGSTEFTQNTKILIIGELITFVLSFGCNYFLIRFLSIEDYSIYNLVLAVPLILLYIGDFGLYYGCSYYIARLNKLNKKELSRNIMKITLIFKSLLGIILAITIFLFADKISLDLLRIQNTIIVHLLQLASILIFTQNLLQAINSILIGSTKMNIFCKLNIIRFSINIFFTILLVVIGWNLFGPIIGLILATSITGLFGLYYVCKNFIKHSEDKQSINWKCLPQIIKRGFSFSIISFITNVKYDVFILFLGIFGYYIGVSYLKVGVSIAAIFFVILNPVVISLFPVFSKYSWNQDSEKTILTQVFHYSIKFCNLFITPVIFFFIIFASELIPLIFGISYQGSTQFISIFLIYFIPLTIGMASIPTFLFSQGHQSFAFLTEFFSFCMSIILGIFFSLFLGSLGFAIGISLGACFGLVFGILITNRKFGKEIFFNIKEYFLIIIIEGLLCGFLFIGYFLLNLLLRIEIFILKLLVLGGIFIFFYILYLIVLIRVNLIKYNEILYFIQEFQKIPLLNRVLHIIVIVGKKVWKRNITS